MSLTEVQEQVSVQSINILRSTQIAAPIEVVFASVLEELGPGSQMPDGKPFPMKIEPWVGGRWYRDLGEMGGHKAGHLWGHVQVIKAPTLLELVGPMPMSFPAVNHVQYRLKAESGGTLLTLHHRAMGLIPAEFRDGMPDGWEHGIKRVKLIAEGKAARK